MKILKLFFGIVLLHVAAGAAIFSAAALGVVLRAPLPASAAPFALAALAAVIVGTLFAASVHLIRRGWIEWRGPTRRRFTNAMVERILLVAYPRGSALLSLMETDPDVAAMILHGAHVGESDRTILRSIAREVRAAWDNASDAPDNLTAALRQAREIYPLRTIRGDVREWLERRRKRNAVVPPHIPQ